MLQHTSAAALQPTLHATHGGSTHLYGSGRGRKPLHAHSKLTERLADARSIVADLRNFLAQLSVFDDRASTHRHLKKESDLTGTRPASRVDGLLNGVPAQQFVVLGYFVQSLSESRRRELASVWIKLGVGWHRSVGRN